LQIDFKKESLSNFWLKRRIEFTALLWKFLMPFSTSYPCETGFSAMLAIKNKYRTRLELEPDLWLKLTKIKTKHLKNVFIETSSTICTNFSSTDVYYYYDYISTVIVSVLFYNMFYDVKIQISLFYL
jgi:hypothetical protein